MPVLQGEALTQFPCMSHGKTSHCHAEFHLLHASTLSENKLEKKLGEETFQLPFLNVYRRVEVNSNAHGRPAITKMFTVI